VSAALDEAKRAFTEASHRHAEAVSLALQAEESARFKLQQLTAAVQRVDEARRQAEAAGHRFVMLGRETVEAVLKASGWGVHDEREFINAVKLVAQDIAAMKL
jgi:hypothetical protein